MDFNELDLKNKMKTWGPFEKKEGMWGIFTVGNACEGHGPALPRMLDDMHAKYVAHRVEFLTGSRYIAHIPYSTDQIGDLAKNWSPTYLPEPIFLEDLTNFITYHLECLQKIDLLPKYLLIILGHGGDRGLHTKDSILLEEFKKFGIIKVVTRFIFEPEIMPEIPIKYQEIANSVGHACNVEHSLAAAMGVLDEEKFKQLNHDLKNDFDGTIRKYPPLVGLSGYLFQGGDFLTKISAHKKGEDPWNCYKKTRQLGHDQIIADAEFGKTLLNITIQNLKRLISQTF